jgi:hypothetical protein
MTGDILRPVSPSPPPTEITMRKAFLLTTILIATAAPIAARATTTHATQSKAIEKANMQQVSNFTLTDSEIHNLLAYSLYNAKHQCGHPPSFFFLNKLGTVPIDRIVADYDASPVTHAALVKNNLTARQAVVGGLAMTIVGLDYMTSTPEGKKRGLTSSGSGENTPALKADMALYKAHLPEVDVFHKQKMAAINQTIANNGGKLPACVMKQLKQNFGISMPK